MKDERHGRIGHYNVTLIQERDEKGEIWTAEHPDLPGCHAVGRDAQEAVDGLAIARDEWITRAKQQGRRVPSPRQDLQYKIVLESSATPDECRFAEQAVLTANENIPLQLFPPGATWAAS